MADAQHTQEKEALEDAANRLLVVNGVTLGTLAFTEVGAWLTQDGGKITGPGYTVVFTPSDAVLKAFPAPTPVSPPPPPSAPPPVTGAAQPIQVVPVSATTGQPDLEGTLAEVQQGDTIIVVVSQHASQPTWTMAASDTGSNAYEQLGRAPGGAGSGDICAFQAKNCAAGTNVKVKVGYTGGHIISGLATIYQVRGRSATPGSMVIGSQGSLQPAGDFNVGPFNANAGDFLIVGSGAYVYQSPQPLSAAVSMPGVTLNTDSEQQPEPGTYFACRSVQLAGALSGVEALIQPTPNNVQWRPQYAVIPVSASPLPDLPPPPAPPASPPPPPPPPPPAPSGSGLQNEVLALGMAVSYADNSVAPSGQTVSGVAWDFGDGATATDASGQYLYAKAGTYPVKETVSYSDGTTPTSTTQVVIGLAPQIVIDGLSILYHLDSNQFVEAVNWQFGDGEIAGDGLADGRHSYVKAGTYQVTGSVTYKAPFADRIDPFGPVTAVVQ